MIDAFSVCFGMAFIICAFATAFLAYCIKVAYDGLRKESLITGESIAEILRRERQERAALSELRGEKDATEDGDHSD